MRLFLFCDGHSNILTWQNIPRGQSAVLAKLLLGVRLAEKSASCGAAPICNNDPGICNLILFCTSARQIGDIWGGKIEFSIL